MHEQDQLWVAQPFCCSNAMYVTNSQIPGNSGSTTKIKFHFLHDHHQATNDDMPETCTKDKLYFIIKQGSLGLRHVMKFTSRAVAEASSCFQYKLTHLKLHCK
jgi:hypothetical protein